MKLRKLSMDPYLSEVFPDPPIVAYKRQRNIRDLLIRAKLPKHTKPYPKRINKGMKRCLRQCGMCPYVKEVNTIYTNKFTWKINQTVK